LGPADFIPPQAGLMKGTCIPLWYGYIIYAILYVKKFTTQYVVVYADIIAGRVNKMPVTGWWAGRVER